MLDLQDLGKQWDLLLLSVVMNVSNGLFFFAVSRGKCKVSLEGMNNIVIYLTFGMERLSWVALMSEHRFQEHRYKQQTIIMRLRSIAMFYGSGSPSYLAREVLSAWHDDWIRRVAAYLDATRFDYLLRVRYRFRGQQGLMGMCK